MSAFCFWDVREVHDRAAMDDYVARVGETVADYGGRYEVVGGAWEAKEGSWRPTYPVLIRFPSLADANAWYDSEAYRALKAQRLRATTGDAVFMASVGAASHPPTETRAEALEDDG